MVNTVVKMLRRAAPQHGVMQRAALMAAKVTRRQIDGRLASGTWQRVLPRVYRVEGTTDSWQQTIHAASLWAGTGFVLSHRTAARLHGFSMFSDDEQVHVTVKRNIRSVGVHCHRISFEGDEHQVIDGLKVTTVIRTIIDLAGTEPVEVLERVVDEALCRRKVTLEKLEAAVKKYARRRGVRVLRRLVEHFAGGGGPAESELEHRVLELLDEAGVPRPEKQVKVRLGKKYRLDFFYSERRVVIEADGYASHSGLNAFEKDRHRMNRLVMQGYVVLRWTWDMVCNHREQLVADVVRCLSRDVRRVA